MTDLIFDRIGHAHTPDRWLFRQVSHRFTPGRVSAVLGPNGRGKSTLLRCAVGLLTPREGRVRGTESTAHVPQSHRSTFDYDVLDMVLMGRSRRLGMFAAPGRLDVAAARDALDQVGMAELAERPFTTLSAGTARSFDRYLLVEIPLPWPPGMGRPLAEYPQVPATLRAPLSRFDAAAIAAGLTAKTLALAPDPDYSVAGHTRVMHYTRPHGPAAGYHRDEYVVPDATAPALIDAMATGEPRELSAFAEYRHDHPHRRDLVVCTHASVDACCGRLGYPLYHALRERLGADHPVRVWRISSFGGHRFAPVAIDLPEGRFWGRLTPDVAVQLANRTGDPAEIIDHYRGWGLLDTTAAQIVEHQSLTEQGWSWIGRPTHATVHEHDDRDTVRIDAGTGPDDLPPSVWEASVEAATTDEVLVGCVGPFGAIQRYRITDLTRPEQAPAALQKARA